MVEDHINDSMNELWDGTYPSLLEISRYSGVFSIAPRYACVEGPEWVFRRGFQRLGSDVSKSGANLSSLYSFLADSFSTKFQEHIRVGTLREDRHACYWCMTQKMKWKHTPFKQLQVEVATVSWTGVTQYSTVSILYLSFYLSNTIAFFTM